MSLIYALIKYSEHNNNILTNFYFIHSFIAMQHFTNCANAALISEVRKASIYFVLYVILKLFCYRYVLGFRKRLLFLKM
jgi:hypothetical protein